MAKKKVFKNAHAQISCLGLPDIDSLLGWLRTQVWQSRYASSLTFARSNFSVNFYEVAISFEMKIIHILLLSLLLRSGLTDAIEPISTSIAVGMAAALTGFLASYHNILHYFHECCQPDWIFFNRTGKQQTSLNVILFIYRISLTCHWIAAFS